MNNCYEELKRLLFIRTFRAERAFYDGLELGFGAKSEGMREAFGRFDALTQLIKSAELTGEYKDFKSKQEGHTA